MVDIGEDLVGAYLMKVHNCPIVQYNVRTHVNQAEIDVVGLRLSQDRVSEVWLCEVSTHTRGLGGYQGDAPGKIAAKLGSVKAYADSNFSGVPRHIEVWSPKVTPAMTSRLEAVFADHSDVELVANDEYASRVRQLAGLARKETAYNDSPTFRLLQILTRLPTSPLG